MESVQQTLNPSGPDQQDAFTDWMRGSEARYVGAKRLPDGNYAGVQRLLYTYGLCLGVTFESPYEKRFCFDDLSQCLLAFSQLESARDEPSGWIARRPNL